MRIKLKSIFKITILAATFSLFFTGCNVSFDKRQTRGVNNSNKIVGSWYALGIKKRRGALLINQTKKEVFYRNGTLISSKWFNFKDKRGRNLGEFYITKSFKWHTKGNKIVVKFNRCSTGVTKKLRAPNLGYYKLKRVCQYSKKRRGKISAKRFRLKNSRTMILGGLTYHKE